MKFATCIFALSCFCFTFYSPGASNLLQPWCF
eukprot:UN20062